MRANFGDALRHAAPLGQRISINPTYIVTQDIPDRRKSLVLPTYKPTGLYIYAVYPSRRNLPGRVRLFHAFLQERFEIAAAEQLQCS